MGTVLPTAGVAVLVAVAVKDGVGVTVIVGDGDLVGVEEGVVVRADCGVEVAVTAGSGMFNIDAWIGGETDATSITDVLVWTVREEGSLIGLHLAPFEVIYK